MAKILVADDELGIRELLYQVFREKGHEVTTAINAHQAVGMVSSQPFDLIILDNSMPGETGVSLLKKIRSSRNQVPIVIYSGFITAELEKEARSAGATEVLGKGLDIDILSNRIGQILKAGGRLLETSGNSQDKLILVVDDEPSIRKLLSDFFRLKNYRTLEAANGNEAIQLAISQKPTVALLDMHMPGMDGLATLKQLLEIAPKLGVVMATAEQNDEMVKKAMKLGAYGYVLKPFDFLYLELVVMSKLFIAEN